MKFPIYVLLATVVDGYALHSSVSQRTCTFSSAFTQRRRIAAAASSTRRGYSRTRGDAFMYEPSPGSSDNKPSSSKKGGDGSLGNIPAWTALANTERWITKTLENSSSRRGGRGGDNPYTRKEVSYVCETTHNAAAVVGSAFRRMREARELGEAHGREEERRSATKGPEYQPGTLRQTQVVVIPSCEELESFRTFDNVVNAINNARRNARDFVTDVSLQKLDENMYGDGERDWAVSVNCAHMHPRYGEKTPEEILAEMEKQESEGVEREDVDVNLEAYKEMRLKARQSPYASLVLEVKASPPPNFGESSPAAPVERTSRHGSGGGGDGVSSVDIQRLEALFGRPAAPEHPANERDDDDDFYAAIGKVSGIEEVSFVTPMNLARTWVAGNDPMYDESSSTFSVSAETQHVDAGYELVFTNIGLECAALAPPAERGEGAQQFKMGKRTYLAMPNFLTSSATSFEKFAVEVTNIIGAIPGLSDVLEVSTLHPEHVDREKRSPVPIFVFQWYDVQTQ